MNSKDRAVSEVVAAILLISLVIIGISIVSVMLTSGPPPEDIPKVSVQMIPKDEDTSGANASFYHGGGDSLRFYATTFTDEKGNPIDLNNVYLVKWNVTSGEKDYEVRWKDHPDLEWNYSSVVNITEINDGYQIHHNVSTGNYLIKEFGTGHSRPIEIPNVTAVPTIVPIPGFCNDTPSAAFTADTVGDYRNNLTCIASAHADNLTHKWTISGKNFLPVSISTKEWSFDYTLPIPYDTNSQGYFIQHTVYNSTPICSDSSIQYVTVPPCSHAPCVAGFSYLVDGKTVQFTADGPDKGFFSWEYGDGQNKTIINNTKVEHTYLDNKSIHSVTLTKKINRCDQDFTCSVTQKVTTESIVCGCFIDNYDPSTRNPWNVEFTWNHPDVCKGLDNKDWKVKFDFGDGSNSETYSKDGFAGITKWPDSNRISHSYTECRDYSVKMDVIDLHGGIYYTCTKTVNLPCICTEEENPTPVFTATEIKSNNTTTIINDTSTPSDIIQWTYDFGDGTTPINFNTTTKPDPFIFTHTYSSCGSYVIKLIVHDAMGCWAETTRTISCGGGNCEPDDIRAEFSATAAPNNPKRFNFIDSSYSNNNTLTRWEWDFGDGTSAINTSPPGTFWIEYDKCGSFPVKLRVWDDIGCWDDVIKEVSCNCPKPIAQFTVESMSNPREFRFTSTSTHDPSVTITDWEWDFGDGVTSTGSSVTHRYTSPGTYTVRLRVTTNCGSWDHTFQDITTGCPSPKAAFEYNNTTNPQQFVFTDRSTHEPFVNISWLWEFGDGTNSTEQNPTHTFPSCSQYTVRLKVTADCGSSNETIQNVICGCPSPKAAFEYTTSANPQEFVFIDRSTHDPSVNLSWLWEFGDGTTSTEQNPTHIYPSCSQYTVRLKVTADCGSSNETIQNVICGCPSPKAAFEYTTSANPQEFVFIDRSTHVPHVNLSWLWEFGDGTTSTEQNPTHTYPSCSQYTVRLKVTADCGSSNDTIQDIVCGCPPPVPDFDYKCIGERTVNFTDLSRGMGNGIRAWYWEFGDLRQDNISGLQNPTHEYDNPGTYPVNLTVFTTCNSSARWTREVTVPCCQMPVPDFTYTCLEDGNTIQFNDTSKVFGDAITRWRWDFGDNAGISSDKNPVYRYNQPGTYLVNLTITTTCGAQNSWIHNITVPCLCSPPIANFTKEMVSSKPFTMRFTDQSVPNSNSITSWNWSFGDGTTYSGQNPPEKTYNSCGEYLVNLRVTNDCGQYDDVDQLVCCPVFANFTYQLDPPDGDAPVTAYFTDLTEGEPNAWHWDFGDGKTSYLQNPVHIYNEGGNYTVTLHATSPCGGNETHSKILTFGCPEVVADFSYTIISEDPFNVSFRDLSYGGEIVDWTWFFGDGTTSKEQHPYHLYAGRENYNVGLIVKNSCGNTAQIWRRIAFDCPNLTADFNLTPSSGMSPLEVKFTDNSTPMDKIMSWLWFFGDGTSYYTTSPPSRNPPNHTYSKIGTYYVTLQVKNECGNPYSTVKTVNVTNPASISGYLWNDKNLNGVRDPEEQGLSNWQVYLQERVAGNWVDRQSNSTDINGDYTFNLPDVTYGTFRIREVLPANWKVTYSYGSGAETYSSALVISTQRQYNEVHFGNAQWRVSEIQIPSRWRYGSSYPGSRGNYPKNWPFDYTTSFDSTPMKSWPQDGTGNGAFIPYIRYENWGDSSFILHPGFYNLYYKTGSAWYWLTTWHWRANGSVFNTGFNCSVPDNTIYRYSDIDLFYLRNYSTFFEFYYPRENELIPYNTSSYVEVHYVGPNENQANGNTNCKLHLPDGMIVNLPYIGYLGYNTGYWNNTKWEGQYITLVARNLLTNGATVTTYRNVSVDFEPVTPVIISPVNNSVVKGLTTFTATVGGKNRNTSDVWLLIDDQNAGQMVFDALNNRFNLQVNVESYAGKTISVVTRAYPLPGKGTFRDSSPVWLRVGSEEPILANFTADPWEGPAPLEVSFTDTSTGGPASWTWNFNDGYTSTLQNPIHIFQNPGNYSVSLQVTNVTGQSSTISKYINTTGVLNTVSLLTNRNGYLHPGYASWLVRGSGSTITVNGTEYTLNNGDRVRLDIGVAQTRANIRIVGEINAFNVTSVILSINGNPVDTGVCSAIKINDFENYHSNLKITAYRQTNAWINLVWNGVPISVQNYQNLEISELMPSTDKIMELSLEPGNIYFDGRASSYRLYS